MADDADNHKLPPDTDSGAIISVSRDYRYVLWRIWNGENRPHLKMLAFVGVNPSTADEELDDQTIRRCISFARDWGYDGIYMVNIWAFRATNPADMKAQGAKDAEGPYNAEWLIRVAKVSNAVVLAWGSNGEWEGGGRRTYKELLKLREPLFSLGQTASGEPKHPVRLSKDTPCKLFEGYSDD